MSGGPKVHQELSRDLTLFHITMMGLGMMIGAGVFVGIGLCTGKVGPGGLLMVFALNGLIALFSAMSFAELASAIPRAGGAYNFARIAFGRPASFLAGWMEWLAASAAGGFYAIVLSTYTLDFLWGMGWMDWLPWNHDVAFPIGVRIFSVLAALFFVFINLRGSSETGKIGALMTLAQMLFVLSVAVVGIVTFFVNPDRIHNFKPFIPDGGWLRMLGAMGIIYVAFEGFEVIAQAGDETVDPRKNLPKAILYSVLFVTMTYVLVAFATMVALAPDNPVLEGMTHWEWIGSRGEDGDGEAGFGAAVQAMLGSWGGLLVTLAVIFSATSALNATIYSATRTSYALGRDRMLPAFFSKISPTRKTPYVALGVTSVIVLSIALSLSVKDGSATASIMFLMLFFLVNICVIRIRRNMGDELDYGYLMPLFPLFPILAIACQAMLAGGIFHESKLAWCIFAGWVAVGICIYFLYSRKRTIATEDEIHVLHEAPAAEGVPGGAYRVMVAVANPASALQLVQNTYALCRAKNDPHVELIHMVPVPDQVSLTDAERFMTEGREAIMESSLYLAPEYPLASTLRYCRNPARGIVSAVAQKRVNLLIMGWHGRPGLSHFAMGSTIDPILERATCDVAVLKNCGGNREFKRVLVPVAGGPHSALALEVGSILAAAHDGELTAFTVAGKTQSLDVGAYIAANRSRIQLPDDRIHVEVALANDVAEAIRAKASEHDLVVLGATQSSRLAKMAHLPIPETLARELDTPLVMVRAAGTLQSWIGRYL